MKKEIFSVQPDEKVILKFRKHWFIFVKDSIGTILATFIPFIVYIFLTATGYIPPTYESPSFVTFISALWLLIVWCALAVIWTDYYLDVWIVTDHRIVNMNQKGLFDRDTTTWRLDRVQEVTIGVKNILQTLLHYGSIEVQTSGPVDEYAVIYGIRDPEIIQQTITKEVDRFMEMHYQGRMPNTPPEDSL